MWKLLGFGSSVQFVGFRAWQHIHGVSIWRLRRKHCVGLAFNYDIGFRLANDYNNHECVKWNVDDSAERSLYDINHD